MAPQFLTLTRYVFSGAILLRLGLLVYSHWQDTHSPVKYTDIDYLVFTDAARFVARGRSPYDRATYRYTPLLAWLLVPTVYWADFGKVLFALADVLAAWLLRDVLQRHYAVVVRGRATAFAAVWALNPMVANISTRGSSEALLGVLAVGLLKAGLERRVALAGVLLGFAVHWKIYPFIYATSLIWWLDRPETGDGGGGGSVVQRVMRFWNGERVRLAVYSFATFMAFNVLMFWLYGAPYLEHSWTYHLTRLDHRHNFSVYNTLLHLHSAPSTTAAAAASGVSTSTTNLERLAFAPQLLLSALAIPLALAKKDLAGAMLCQTFAFVTFNKVCTSQYFLWYLVFLPVFLPGSRLLVAHRPRLGALALLAWVLVQAGWLWQGYRLEFRGEQTFVPGLWSAGLVFFGVNCWILGLLIADVAGRTGRVGVAGKS